MHYFTDGRNKLIRVDFNGVVDDLDSMHAFSSANAERWAARDGWQPSSTATSGVQRTRASTPPPSRSLAVKRRGASPEKIRLCGAC
jgi:hypothetical protein